MLVWPRWVDTGKAFIEKFGPDMTADQAVTRTSMHEMRSICSSGQSNRLCGQF